MTTPPAPAPHTDAPAPRTGRALVALTVGGAVTVLALAALAMGCESLGGGRVMSESAFREHMRRTQEAGEDAVRRLGIDPNSVIDDMGMSSASCADDFGADSGGVTRDQPTLTWAPEFADRAAYRAAVETLRKAWSAQGMTVESLPARAKGEPGAGLPGVSATTDDGIELYFRSDWYSGEPTLVADGGCVRHEGITVDWE